MEFLTDWVLYNFSFKLRFTLQLWVFIVGFYMVDFQCCGVLMWFVYAVRFFAFSTIVFYWLLFKQLGFGMVFFRQFVILILGIFCFYIYTHIWLFSTLFLILVGFYHFLFHNFFHMVEALITATTAERVCLL